MPEYLKWGNNETSNNATIEHYYQKPKIAILMASRLSDRKWSPLLEEKGQQ